MNKMIATDGRTPDYDDWKLNGDIAFWGDVLSRDFEVSSMGIRVDEKSLVEQLTMSGCDSRRALPFYKMLLAGELPLTMGGGIGQSRLCMRCLGKRLSARFRVQYGIKIRLMAVKQPGLICCKEAI